MSDVKQTAERISTERLEQILADADAPNAYDGGKRMAIVLDPATVKAMATELLASRHADAQQGGELRVKPLEWLGEEGQPGKDIRAYPTPEIQYTVRHLDMDTFDVILSTDLGSKWFRNDGQIHASCAQAKAAAQADYEQRIRSALSVNPQIGSDKP